jgi:hypothetical protein
MAVRRHPKAGERHLDLLTWGFVPHWAVDPKTERKPITSSEGKLVMSGFSVFWPTADWRLWSRK